MQQQDVALLNVIFCIFNGYTELEGHLGLKSSSESAHFSTEKVGVVVTHLTCILEVPGFSLCWDTPDVFCGFPQSLTCKCQDSASVRLLQLPYRSLPVLHSPVNLKLVLYI